MSSVPLSLTILPGEIISVRMTDVDSATNPQRHQHGPRSRSDGDG